MDGIINAASATMMGAEIETSWTPTDGLLLGLNGAWIDAEYNNFIDEDFAYIPELTWSVMAQYTWDLDIGELSPRLSGYYSDEVFIGLDAESVAEDEAYLEDYWVWNLRVAFRPTALENLEVAGYVNNPFDEEYIGTGIISTGGIGAASYFPGRQQTWGVEFNYSWY